MDVKNILSERLEKADIRIDGDRPWDIRVRNPKLYERVIREGTLGVGEAYMNSWWDCDRLDIAFYKAIKAGLTRLFSENNFAANLLKFYQTLFNLQKTSRSRQVAETHYNLDNDLFAYMLGTSMNYSCAYWREAEDLDKAQIAKMDLICRKLKLSPGMTVLDIGCGWGALGEFMRENYDVRVTGVSVSEAQIKYAKEHFPDNVWLLDDYRNLAGSFDRIVSVGMFEHVGYKNYREFMLAVRRLLKDDGLFLLHTIGTARQRKGTDPWINKYIFPNGMIPGIVNVTEAFADIFTMEDWHNFGADYDKTLMAWDKRFEEGASNGKFPITTETRRMFRYYLLSCAGAFRARDLQLWQILLSPDGVPGGYVSAR